jgi:hypothetical protein
MDAPEDVDCLVCFIWRGKGCGKTFLAGTHSYEVRLELLEFLHGGHLWLADAMNDHQGVR